MFLSNCAHLFRKGLLFFIVFPASLVALGQDTAQMIVFGRTNSAEQQQKPYVILISADGFRYDLADKYQARTLLKLRDQGVNAAYMEPSYPSLTFPNHYTLATGLYPAHHGLVDNSFYDPARKAFYNIGNRKAVQDSSWYGGTPIWVLAEQEQMVTASFYWVGSEAAIQGVRPTYSYAYSTAIPIDERIEVVKDWLQLPPAIRPHLITFYFPEVDHAEHLYGPDSWEAKAAVAFIDASVGKMVTEVGSLQLPVNFIFVSDHGMTKIDTTHLLPLPDAVDTSKFIVPKGDALLHLYAKDKKDIKPTYERLKAEAKDFDVYLAADLPSRWHYSKRDDRFGRIGDIVLVPHLPYAFSLGRPSHNIGYHGFDPAIPDMRATFYAWGPAFKPHQKIDGFENVDVFPLVAKILGLTYTEKIDGSLGPLERTLVK